MAALVACLALGEPRAAASSEQDRIAIERLHRQDVEATLSDDADRLVLVDTR